MEFDHAFSVAAPIDTVWTTITDVQRVTPCVPSTRVTRRVGPESCDVEIKLAEATVTIALTEAADATDAAVHSSVELGGIGVLVSADALDQVAAATVTAFAENLEALLRRAPNAAA